jgi:hypothetical protein
MKHSGSHGSNEEGLGNPARLTATDAWGLLGPRDGMTNPRCGPCLSLSEVRYSLRNGAARVMDFDETRACIE